MANQQNLFEYDDFFNLIAYGTTYSIEEPIGFDAAGLITGSRDKDFFGFNYEFIDSDKLELTFREGEGLEIIKGIYKLNGSDGKIIFEYGFRYLGSRYVQFLGSLNLNNYKVTDDGVACTIEKIMFDGKLRSRSETKISFNRTTDLDGNAVTPPVPMQIKMHSKKILKNGRVESTYPVVDMYDHFFNHSINWLQFDSTNLVKSEVEELFSYPLAITTDDFNPISEKRYYFQPSEAGRMKIKFDANYTLNGQVALVQEGGTTWAIESSIVVRRNNQTLLNFAPANGSTSGTFVGSKTFSAKIVFSLVTEFDLQKGDEVYCLTKITTPGVSIMVYKIQTILFSIDIEQQTLVPPSVVSCYKLIDALRFILKCITGEDDVLISRLFDIGGEAEKYIITNGFQLRNFSGVRSLSASWRDLTEGLSPIFLLGIQFSRDRDVIVDFAKNIFGTSRILDFTSVYDYGEEHEKSLTFNEIEIGYNKFAEDEANTLDDPHTNRIFLTPISTYKSKYTQKTNLITSGYLIEQVRREQFKEAPSTSLSQDDDIFLIAYITESIYSDVNYRFANIPDTIILNRPIGLIPGDKFRVNSAGGLPGANNNTIFTVIGRDNFYDEGYNITPQPVAENNFGTIENIITMPQAERNEAFGIVKGVISPETSVNLRITPSRMLYNHSYIINSGLINKLDTDKIQNTYTKSNGDLITRFNDSEPVKLLIDNYTIKESADIELSKFNKRDRLCVPRTATFKTRLDYSDLVKLKLSLTGAAANPADNYGCISFPDLDGEVWEGIVWAFNYDPPKEECSFTVRKTKRIR